MLNKYLLNYQSLPETLSGQVRATPLQLSVVLSWAFSKRHTHGLVHVKWLTEQAFSSSCVHKKSQIFPAFPNPKPDLRQVGLKAAMPELDIFGV